MLLISSRADQGVEGDLGRIRLENGIHESWGGTAAELQAVLRAQSPAEFLQLPLLFCWFILWINEEFLELLVLVANTGEETRIIKQNWHSLPDLRDPLGLGWHRGNGVIP